MTYEEAVEWLQGQRSSVNYMPQDKIAETDAFMTQQAYWIVKAHHEEIVAKEPK